MPYLLDRNTRESADEFGCSEECYYEEHSEVIHRSTDANDCRICCFEELAVNKANRYFTREQGQLGNNLDEPDDLLELATSKTLCLHYIDQLTMLVL